MPKQNVKEINCKCSYFTEVSEVERQLKVMQISKVAVRSPSASLQTGEDRKLVPDPPKYMTGCMNDLATGASSFEICFPHPGFMLRYLKPNRFQYPGVNIQN